MDQQRLLTTTRIYLSDFIKEVEPRPGYVVLKNIPNKSYLTVNKDQWDILQRFKKGNTAAEVLPQLIIDRKCPPLREFYELILKALHTSILVEKDWQPKPVKAVNWKLYINYRFTQIIGTGFIIFGFFSLFIDGVQIPTHFWEISLGYILTGLGLSLGYFLAGCTMRGYNCEVYHLQLHWRTLVPHFRVDIQDARMGGRFCEVSVALMRMAPVFLITGLCSYWYPDLEFVMVLGIFWLTCPFGGSPTADLVASLYRLVQLSTVHDFLFVQNKLFWSVLNAKIKFTDKKYLLIYSFYVLGWTYLVFYLSCRIFEINSVQLITDILYGDSFRPARLAVLLTLGLLILGSGFLGMWILIKNLVRIAQNIRFNKRIEISFVNPKNITETSITKLLGTNILFRESEPELLKQIASVVKCVEYKAKSYVITEGEFGDSIYIIYSGKVEVVKELSSGRPVKLAELTAGDAFGEMALLDKVPRTRSVRTLQNTIFLRLGRDDFQRLVVKYLGADKIKEMLQKTAFLERLPLCKNWHPQALQRFSALSVLIEIAPNQKIIQRERDSQFFYIIYEGSFDVIIGNKKIATLHTGEFLGEIGLLRNTVSTADVVATEKSICLSLHKQKFLNFLGSDFFIGLQFERIGSKRLGKPIFPMPNAFDMTGAI